MNDIIPNLAPLLTWTQVFGLVMLLLIPGQGFWTGVALAKHSFKTACTFQFGCLMGITAIYGMLNTVGDVIAKYIDTATLDVIRGSVLIFIGTLTLYSVIRDNADSNDGLLKKLKDASPWIAFGFGVGLMLINPLPYAFLAPYAPPFVRLEHHWLVYGLVVEAVVFSVYSTAYYFASLTSSLSRRWYGKLVWSIIALLPIYYGLAVLLS